ncbi:MAG: polysaccharide pyruvyl transferase CsaB [Muribaculaceae bacterium]|nr:polysaccharide pyruvyl transferase CsaB [Muribaculaceae bacterium]
MAKKRFVLSGYFGFRNFGDEAILSVLVNKLKELDCHITVISSHTEYTKSKFAHIRSVYTFNMSAIVSSVMKTDYLISGGGSLLQDVTSFKSLIYYLLVIFLGLLFGKKVIIFAQGIGPVTNPLGQFLTKTLLRHCTYVSVRDKKSFDLLKSWGINADLLCDPVFSTQIEPAEKNGSVAVQLRDFKTMNEDFIDRLAQQVCKDFPDRQIDVYSFQDDIDKNVCERFINSLNLLNPEIKTVLHTNLTDSEIVSGISKSEYLIAMRFHAIIIGLISNVKTLAIDYDIKVQKLAAEFNLPIIDLKSPFADGFERLKSQDLAAIKKIVGSKAFDWSGFFNTISE